MGLHHHRKLFDCEKIPGCSYSPSLFPPPSNENERKKDNPTPTTKHTPKISTYLIISFAVVAAAIFLLCCYALYAKFFSSRNRSRRRLLSRQQTEAEGFDDEEEEGPVVDHPIWYIRTTGLQQSVIGAITVCKYKRGEGLIEGTECSVCLSEFQEDENLRLLPKCNHAFHLPCIDTWLRSHTNCPLCRAPIVTDPTIRFIPSVESNAVASSSSENAQREGLEHSGGEGSGGMENSEEGEEGEEVEEGRRVCETAGSLASEVVNMQPRRSVSLDSSSAAKISLALASVMSVESNRSSKRVSGNGKGGSSSSRTRHLHSEPSSMKRSRSFNAKHLISWYSRSQRKPNPPLRSF